VRLPWMGPVKFRDHAIINPANVATFLVANPNAALAGADLGNPTSPAPCGVGHFSLGTTHFSLATTLASRHRDRFSVPSSRA
jgi:hypothetical protein